LNHSLPGVFWFPGSYKNLIINNYEVFLATGYGGQFVINFPALNLIVVTTAESHLDCDTADEHERSILSIVADYIVPAVN